MNVRKTTWKDIHSILILFDNDIEKVTYVHTQIAKNSIKVAASNIDIFCDMLKCIKSLAADDMKLFFAKMIRPMIDSHARLIDILEKLAKNDRAKYANDQDYFWEKGRSESEEEEINVRIQMIEHPELLVRQLAAQHEQSVNNNSFRARLAAINFTGEIPEYMTCPISGEIMDDPVSMSSGIFYNRASIAAWFELKLPLNQIPCPKTNVPIDRHELEFHTNVVMRYLIDDFVKTAEEQARLVKDATASNDSKAHAGFFSSSTSQGHSEMAGKEKSDKRAVP